jgi:hypothetical protein
MLWRAQLDFVVPSIGGARQETSKPGFILARAEVD